MNVEEILKVKGRTVETIEADAPVVTAVGRMMTLGIGALVVSPDGQRSEGLVAERDVVRAVLRHGPRLPELRVAEVMSRNVATCRRDDPIKHVMALMTRTRSRHLPVIERGRLCGLVSIGDLVKYRLDEAEMETNVLRDRFLAIR